MSRDSIFRFFVFLLILIAGLYIIKYFNISYPITITTTTKSTELSVVGEGQVEVVPDTAYVDVGVQVDNVASVEVAQKTITEKNNAIVAALKALSIPEEDIKTSNFSVYPNYSYDRGQNNLLGYSGNVSLSIKASDVSMTAKIIEVATSSGANQIQGTRFVVDKPERYREEAREKAIQNAKEQAEKLAKSSGIRLGRVVNIVESSPQSPPIFMEAKMDASISARGGGELTQFQPGSQTITSVVTLYFEKR